MDTMDYDTAVDRAQTPGKLVWHYTNLDTLTLILQSNCLLATEVSFQNDIRETSTADSAFMEVLGEISNNVRYSRFARDALTFLRREDDEDPSFVGLAGELVRKARFILCASNDPDSLYAWRTYAQGGIGCAIGLDPGVPLGVVNPKSSHQAPRIRHWRKVTYSPSKTHNEARRLLERLGEEWLVAHEEDTKSEGSQEAMRLLITHLTEVRSSVRAIAKDPAFADENEHRVTVEDVPADALTITPSSMGPRPHVRLVTSGAHRWGEVYPRGDLAPRLPIRAIRLGPNAPESARTATQWLLLSSGYRIDPDYAGDDFRPYSMTWEDTVLLRTSAHPYRSR